MKRLTIILLLATALPALAQDALPPPFAPITIGEGDFNKLKNYLDDQPAKFARPLLNWLDEQRGIAAAKAAAQAKADAQKSPPEKQ